MNALFVAVDGGAREALAPVAAQCGSALADCAAHEAESDAYWTQTIVSERPVLLVVGTSDSARGRIVEGAARTAAKRAGLPVVAIEDFPGNYYDVAGGEASLVLVESPAARALCIQKFGVRAPRVEVAIAARYDPYRARLAELRARTAQCWAAPARKTTVLWAGQPETDDALHTLRVLLPVLREHVVELLFKAHPRDAGYTAGAYRSLLEASGVAVSDLTSASVEDALSKAPWLIVTQFSSIAIEGGFFGVPSLWVLLPEAGGARLEEKKGYRMPPLCAAQGAAYAADTHALAEAFERTVCDLDFRKNLMRCFDDYFAVSQCGMAHLMKLLQQTANLK